MPRNDRYRWIILVKVLEHQDICGSLFPMSGCEEQWVESNGEFPFRANKFNSGFCMMWICEAGH